MYAQHTIVLYASNIMGYCRGFSLCMYICAECSHAVVVMYVEVCAAWKNGGQRRRRRGKCLSTDAPLFEDFYGLDYFLFFSF